MAFKNKKLVSIIITMLIFTISIVSCAHATTYNEAVSGKVSKDKINNVKQNIDLKRKKTKNKIKDLKIKEAREINKLYKSQGNLEVTKKELEITSQNLEQTKQKLSKLQNSLDEANIKYNRDQIEMGKRLREIYKGERISFLNVIFMSENINSMLDKIYFQQVIAEQDSQQLKNLQKQINLLSSYTKQIEEQKQSVYYTMMRIQSKKDKIAQDICTSQYLIKKLQTDRKTYEQAERELARQSNRLTQMLRSNMKTAEKFTTTTDFIMPVRGSYTSAYGYRVHPIFKTRKFHSGIDIAVPSGTPVKCSNSGVVTFVGWYGGYGKVVIVSHGTYKGKPTSTLYAHLSSYSVSKGAKVAKGQIIGHSGSTGYSTGPHLHFEVRVNGNPVSPTSYAH
ncbi:MAG: peptidoglycan DD-metalloendopeptidase family protein [Candidatus Gastranaerophilales bacterium]|nr:peptidoglycan DD-metalloendopeptidase family protein [Candidatus Gastranaerophilales bacterium]